MSSRFSANRRFVCVVAKNRLYVNPSWHNERTLSDSLRQLGLMSGRFCALLAPAVRICTDLFCRLTVDAESAYRALVSLLLAFSKVWQCVM